MRSGKVFLRLLLGFTGLLLLGCQAEHKGKRYPKMLDRVTVTAHSGAYWTEDNTMEYIQAALEHHAQVIEFDIRMRPDGTLAMCHDSITSQEEGVEMKPAFEAIRGSGSLINLDIKQTDALRGLSRLIWACGIQDEVFLTGVSEQFVSAVRKDCPGIPYFINCSPDTLRIQEPEYRESLIRMLEEYGGVGINCNYRYASRTLSDLLHENGYLLSVWTVDSEEDARRMLALHPDNITSRKPQMVQALMGRTR